MPDSSRASSARARRTPKGRFRLREIREKLSNNIRDTLIENNAQMEGEEAARRSRSASGSPTEETTDPLRVL